MTTSPPSGLKLPETKLDVLHAQIVLAFAQQRTREPGLRAIGLMGHESGRWGAASRYTLEIQRILRELSMAIEFIERIAFTAPEHGAFFPSEDGVMYHQGHALDLVHQLKDKVARLVDALTMINRLTKKASITNLLKKPRVSELPGLADVLREWEEAHHGGIATALHLRTQYHHFQNNLSLHDKYLSLKTTRLLQQPEIQNVLTKAGKHWVCRRGEQDFRDWRDDILRKLRSTRDLVQKNIEKVAQALSVNTGLPNIENDGMRIIQDELRAQKSLNL